jgi:hypothetical protein
MIHYVISDRIQKLIPMQVEVTNEGNTVCEYSHHNVYFLRYNDHQKQQYV